MTTEMAIELRVMMSAELHVLGLSVLLATVAATASSLQRRTRWLLFMLALVAGILVMLRRWGRYD